MRNITLMTEARFAKQGEALHWVTLPHTWNNFDGQDGGSDYWRGIGTYEIPLPNPTFGKKQYIEIQGANHVATVYCNGQELGTHKGGFSTFRYDLTSAMKPEKNLLTVVVSNAPSDIYPQAADFTFYGGLYRDVNFIEVNNMHFDLLKEGTSGVFVTPHCSGVTRIDLFPVATGDAVIYVKLKDKEGNTVAAGKVKASKHAYIIIDVKNPHLWDGMNDPYCYTAEANIVVDEEIVDTVNVTYGYRSFHVDPNTGFWLNGKNVPLRGVARHQDRQDKGWAVSKADHKEDIDLIKELGANTIRLAHYQHDQYFYDLCDEVGFAIWAEIPFISKFIPTKEAYDNTISQMTELIAQNYNHPSIFFWGIANEVLIGEDNEPLRENLRNLNKLAKIMDPSRLTTSAEVCSTPIGSEHIYITDIISYNLYYGWYGGEVSQNGPWCDRFHELNPSVALGISEYGAENIVRWHSATPMNHDYTEEFASEYHHGMLKTFATRPYLWSTYVWNCFDFAADARDEGGVLGRNSKGIITYDRKVKKDAFFIYKAYWNPEPMIYVAGRRFKDRAPEERNITVYTNCKEITLFINDVQVETKVAVDHAVVFENVMLADGSNIVTAKFEEIEDTITLNGVSKHNEEYTLPDIAEAIKVGNWFDAIADNSDSEEIEIIEGYYSIEDPGGELIANEECFKIVKGWFVKEGDLTIASMLKSLQSVLGFQKVYEWAEGTCAASKKEWAQLNRQLSKIKKSN